MAEDFANRRDYDDYLELKQDIVYDIVYGDKITASNAEKRLKEFSVSNRLKIQSNQTRQVSKLMEAEHLTNAAEVDKPLKNLTVPFHFIPYDFVAQQVEKIPTQEDLQLRKSKEKSAEAKRAAGFEEDEVMRRCQLEVLSTLWIL